MRFYKNLDEAFEDMEVGKSLHKRVEMQIKPGDIAEREKEFYKKHEVIGDWVKRLFKLKFSEETEYTFLNKVNPFMKILKELVINAWEHGSRAKAENKFVIEIYAGRKGVLIGTEQLKGNFLSLEQIAELRAGKPATTRRTRGGPGGGTEICLNTGDGILITEQEKAIYVVRYF